MREPAAGRWAEISPDPDARWTVVTRRSASSALMSLAMSLERLVADRTPVEPSRVHPRDGFGAVSAETVSAPADVPAHPTASRDGWAVAFATIAGASQTSPVVLPQAPRWVEAGEALPAGTDTVLPPEAIEAGTGREVIADAAPGEGCAGIGSELGRGTRIIRAGDRVGSLGLLALGHSGVHEIAVRAPRVALLACRDDQHLHVLQPIVAALVTSAGCQVILAGSAPDGPDGLARALADAPHRADAVFVLGGTGMGHRDQSAAALAEAGTLAAHGIALRPGETAGFGDIGGCPVLLLPGRPDATISAFVALGRPLLRRLCGHNEEEPAVVAPLRRKLSSPLGVSELVFVRRVGNGIEPLGSAGTPLHRLLEAEGTILVPPDREGYPEGRTVEMTPLWTIR